MVTDTTNPAAKLDAYELRHLVSHLEFAKREDDLHRLLSLETVGKKNAWYEAKETAGDLQGYLVDVNQAWRIAERAYSLDNRLKSGANIGRQFHYALIIASLNSLASNVPPGLLSAAVQEGLSTPDQAFASIKGLPDEALLAASLAELAPHLTVMALLRQATTTARNIASEPDRDLALNALALQWARQQQVTEVGAIIKEFTDEASLSRLIAGLAPLLPADNLPELLRHASLMSKSESQASAFSALAPHLSPADSETFLKAVQKIRSQRLRALTFISTLPYLPEPRRSQVLAKSLQSTQSLRNLVTRAEITAALLPHLQEKKQDESLLDLIQDIQKLKDGDKRGAAWGEIAAFLPKSKQKQAFAGVLAIKNKRVRAEALEKFAPTLTQDDDKRAAVSIARKIDVREYQVRTMASILPYLSGRLRHSARSSAWKAAKEIKNAEKRGQAFRLLAPYLTNAMWQQTMQILRRARSAEARAFMIQGIAAHLPDDMLEMALAVAARIPPGPERAASLAALTPRFSAENLLTQAMTTAREIADTDAQLTALVALAPGLATAGDQVEALEIVGRIRDADSRALALAGLVPRLSSLERRRAIERVVAAVYRIKQPQTKAQTIEQIAPTLPREMLRLALDIEDQHSRAYALLALIPHLPEDLRRSAQQEALAAVGAIMAEREQGQNDAFKEEELGSFWTSFTATWDPLEMEALESDALYWLEDLWDIRGWRKRRYAEELLTLIPLLADTGYLAEAIEAAEVIEADVPDYAWDAYASIVPYLEEPERTQTIQRYLIDGQHFDVKRITILGEIAPETLAAHRKVALKALQNQERLNFSFLRELDQFSWASTDYADSLVDLGQAWAALARCQPEPHRRKILVQGIERTQNSETELIYGPMLVALLPDVAELGYPEKALEAARSIPTPADRALALGGISPYMPPERWPDLLQASLAIEEDESKAAFLAGLAPILPQELVAEVLAAARQIESPTARLQALVPLAVRVSQNPLDDALYSLWRDILHLLSRGTRRDLLGYVPVLASVMVALRDSDQIIKDIVHSVIRVSRSWP